MEQDIKEAKEFLAMFPGRQWQMAVLTEAKRADLARLGASQTRHGASATKTKVEGESRKAVRRHARQWARASLKAIREMAVMNN